jgi:hypothetical protein
MSYPSFKTNITIQPGDAEHCGRFSDVEIRFEGGQPQPLLPLTPAECLERCPELKQVLDRHRCMGREECRWCQLLRPLDAEKVEVPR